LIILLLLDIKHQTNMRPFDNFLNVFNKTKMCHYYFVIILQI